MKVSKQLTDSAILGELGTRLAQARLNGNLTQQEIAHAAGIAKRTVERIESGESSQLSNVVRLMRALGLIEQLDTLLPAALPSPIEQLKRRAKERKRASSRKEAGQPTGKWIWGDEK